MTASFDSPLMSAALDYASRGWRVFPLKASTKGRDAQGRSTHLLENGHKGASTDRETIRAWWMQWPDANIGLSLAASGLVALDPDTYKPDCAWHSFIQGREMPATLVQSSARGGKHYIFQAPQGARFHGKLCDGVEIKHRGYIVVEPSTFEGRAYRFETDDAPAVLPDWVPFQIDPLETNKPSQAKGATYSLDFCDAESGTSEAEVRELLSFIDPDADGYDSWLKILQALHDHFGGAPVGLELAIAWSQRGLLFRPGEVEAKWSGFTAGAGVTLKTIAQRARMAGADLSAIAKRHGDGQGGPRNTCALDSVSGDDPPDLSHDHLALDLEALQPGNPSLLTTEELAARWSMSARSFELWRRRGKGPAWMRVGRRVLYRLSDVLEYEVSREQR